MMIFSTYSTLLYSTLLYSTLPGENVRGEPKVLGGPVGGVVGLLHVPLLQVHAAKVRLLGNLKEIVENLSEDWT